MKSSVSTRPVAFRRLVPLAETAARRPRVLDRLPVVVRRGPSFNSAV